MSLATIKAFISQNTVDLDPAVVQAKNSVAFPTVGDVADYCYKSFGAIWLPDNAAITCGAIARTIHYKKGETTNTASQEIVLLSLPEESYQNAEGSNNNDPGALDYYMEILYKLPEGAGDFDKLMNCSYKMRWLLDKKWRQRRKERPIWIIMNPPVDKALGTEGILCEWLGFVNPPNGVEILERWFVKHLIVVPF